jgi:AcrR family transcriptional regulator
MLSKSPFRDNQADVSGDRRVRRTRRTLAEALVALVLERGYERITVADLLTRADVGRSTFYSHFRDKDDLLMSCFDDLRADLYARVADQSAPVGALFEHAYRHREMYQALCGRRSGETVLRQLHRFYAEMLRTHHVALDGTVAAELRAEFLAGAAIALLRWWLDADMPEPPAAMADYYTQLADGARPVNGLRPESCEQRIAARSSVCICRI